MSSICKIFKGSKFYIVSYFRFRKITEQKVLENNWFYFYSRSSYIYHINFILTNFLVFDEPPFFLGICVVHSWCWKSWIYHDLFWSNWGHLKSSPRGSCKMYRNIVSYCSWVCTAPWGHCVVPVLADTRTSRNYVLRYCWSMGLVRFSMADNK